MLFSHRHVDKINGSNLAYLTGNSIVVQPAPVEYLIRSILSGFRIVLGQKFESSEPLLV